jgi:hypothetical protein
MDRFPVFLSTVLSSGIADRVDLNSWGAAFPSSCVTNLESGGGGGRISEKSAAFG